jgi:hypothetical protein
MDNAESIELAFIVALQHLPGTQRAALILRDVLGFSSREAAEALDTTVPSVNGALRRARRAVEERLPERSQQATLRALGDAAIREVVERYIDAWERGDVEAILALLAKDAKFTMPPLPTWYHGRDAIAIYLRRSALIVRWRVLPAGQTGSWPLVATPGRRKRTPIPRCHSMCSPLRAARRRRSRRSWRLPRAVLSEKDTPPRYSPVSPFRPGLTDPAVPDRRARIV